MLRYLPHRFRDGCIVHYKPLSVNTEKATFWGHCRAGALPVPLAPDRGSGARKAETNGVNEWGRETTAETNKRIRICWQVAEIHLFAVYSLTIAWERKI